MKPMKVYIAGPMTGIEDYNFPAFHEAAAKWRALGHEVFNPAETDNGDTTNEWEYYMKKDIAMLLQSDAVALLPGWEKSKGATLEVTIATHLGLKIYDAETFDPIDPKMKIVNLQGHDSALVEALMLVHGDRQESYGHPIEDFTRTGRMWGAILGIPDIDPRIVAIMMAAVKISREVHKPKRDNRVDLAGYAETAEMVAQKQAELKQSEPR